MTTTPEEPRGSADPTSLAAAETAAAAGAAGPVGAMLAAESEIWTTETGSILTDRKPLRRYLTWFTIATAAATAVWGATGLLLANHVQIIETANFFTGANAGVDLQALTQLKAEVEAGTATPTPEQTEQLALLSQFDVARATSLAVVTTITGLIGMLLAPVIGQLSDRTRSRWGRRAPYILFGGLIGAVGLMILQFAPNLAVLTAIWCVASVSVGAAQSGLMATVADRVTEFKRGTASALGGLGNMVGGTIGGLSIGIAFGFLGLGAYAIPAIMLLLGCGFFVLFAKDRSSRGMAPEKKTWGQFFAGFTVALRSSDFRWVWIARLIFTFGYTLSTAFGLYILQSYVRPALSQTEATAFSPLLALIGLPFMVVSLLVSGRLSDKLKRRKVFVIAASIGMAGSFLIPLISPTLPALLIQAVVASLAFGVYLAVDQALFIDVLPERENAGRDLGVAGLGSSIGQSLAPIIGAWVVAVTSGYAFVFVVAAVLALISAFVIIPVKKVR